MAVKTSCTSNIRMQTPLVSCLLREETKKKHNRAKKRGKGVCPVSAVVSVGQKTTNVTTTAASCSNSSFRDAPHFAEVGQAHCASIDLPAPFSVIAGFTSHSVEWQSLPPVSASDLQQLRVRAKPHPQKKKLAGPQDRERHELNTQHFPLMPVEDTLEIYAGKRRCHIGRSVARMPLAVASTCPRPPVLANDAPCTVLEVPWPHLHSNCCWVDLDAQPTFHWRRRGSTYDDDDIRGCTV